ncbi:acyl-CoA desaturase [Aureliella helgolandensis]|uniref:Fatty acid desaturase n=1 Tax=Aureliella helgolandensis TaxID=2527968 RepID=A0A518G647_9BACT|nr:fatty acid desaturase [Aureliella helgolandensis]QDV24065.1 Fatty acid desaturase [Aureliella helgolandensis]
MNNPVPAPVLPYRMNWTYSVTIVLIHLLGFLALIPYLFSWTAFWVFVIGIHVFGQGITIGYHRLLTHRSFKCPKWVERVFAILGICSMQDTPARWVSVHRQHHVHSDEIPDPHSPRVTFFWSHMGWLMWVNRQTYSAAGLEKFAKDLLRDRFYMRLELNPFQQFKYLMGQFVVFFAAGFGISFLFSPELSAAVQLGASMVTWGVIMRVIAVWHITWSVNSLSHMFGYRNYETNEGSRNNWLVALLSVGEGWHNNHHEDPSAASVQHRWWELDISYYEIKLLEMVGLASDVIPPRQMRHGHRPTSKATDKRGSGSTGDANPPSDVTDPTVTKKIPA